MFPTRGISAAENEFLEKSTSERDEVSQMFWSSEVVCGGRVMWKGDC